MSSRGMRQPLIMIKTKRIEYYKGLKIQTDTCLHDQAIRLLNQYVGVSSRVLDVGAGSGAFSKRMVDSGFEVVAVDMAGDEWAHAEIPFLKVNINSGIAPCMDSQFDAACCLEVIEHIENPWHLLREIFQVLKPGGKLILSTPNISSFLSRLVFLRTGEFHQFRSVDLHYGHIRPITSFELTIISRAIGWRVVEIRPGGYLPIFDLTSFGLKSMMHNILRGVAYLFAKGHKHGWCLFFVLEKPR